MAAGAYTRLPKLATGMFWLRVTGAPPSVSVPTVGRVVMITALRLLAGVSIASAKPKSAAVRVRLPSSSTVMVVLTAVGASLTVCTVISTLSLSLNVPSLLVMVSWALP